ncbi:hypothetical protein [Delftia sp. PS-11]|uniref:hypothetical protein n=1 Tax=Delftia sp. PS-11 TaxID=2767222 RepID=UPI0024588650|nr:hypothetical protein [Delftia sp. PS-11]KAJ8743663.1 hypothetical protein H9T68_15815 [Delftia sp. PS-11]
MNIAATELIDRLGGSTAVANRLGWRTLNGSRRVNNWKRRGIPPSVQLQNDWLRMSPELALPTTQPPAGQEVTHG